MAEEIVQISGGLNNRSRQLVNKHGQALTQSESLSSRFVHSAVNEDVFQVEGACVPIAGEEHLLYIKNTDEKEVIVISEIALQLVAPVANPALPLITSFFEIHRNPVLASGASIGGTAVAGVNSNFNSSHSDKIETVSGIDAIPAGVASPITNITKGQVIETVFPKANGERVIIHKEESIVVPSGGSIGISYTTATLGGIAIANVSYSMREIANLFES